VLVVSACSDAPRPVERIVLVSLDTLRADHLEAYGYARDTSPAIREVADSGVRFANVVTASSWTLPAHASMLTGLDAAGHRAFTFHPRTAIPDSVVMLPERLREHGFRTAAFVGGVFVSRRQAFDQGFETFSQPARDGVLPKRNRMRQSWEAGIEWLREHRDERAFLFLHTYRIHAPYRPREPYDRIFDAEADGPQPLGYSWNELQPRSWAARASERPRAVDRLRRLYDGEIRSADDLIGELVQVLRDEDWGKRTCLVLTSDHGEEFGEHGELFHDSTELVQELIEVPLIFWCPGRFPSGRVVTEPVGIVDIVPTLLELAGLPVPEGLDGISLVPLMRGGEPAGARALVSDVDLSIENPFLPFGAVDDFALAIRVGRNKLVYHSEDGSRRLYDLGSDPDENVDLATSRPDLLARLEPQLERAIARRRAARSHARPPDASDAERDSQFIEQLRALGYVE